MNLANSFRDRLIRNAELSEAGNTNLELYRDASDPSITNKAEMIRFLTVDKEGSVLVVNDQGGLTLIHSITNLGGTFARHENKLVCLQGLANSATPLLLDLESLTEQVPMLFCYHPCPFPVEMHCSKLLKGPTRLDS